MKNPNRRDFPMATGTVKWFNPTKGYGFIQPKDGSGKDVFVHISVVERAGLSTLNDGQSVEYEIVESRGKSSAENLKVARKAVTGLILYPNCNQTQGNQKTRLPRFGNGGLLASRGHRIVGLAVNVR
jgi:CspA family cold shock protein